MELACRLDVEEGPVLDVAVESIGSARDIGRVAGGEATYGYAVAHYGSTNMLTLRYRLSGLMVEAAESTFEAEGLEFAAGSFIIPRPHDPNGSSGRSRRSG